MREILRNIQKKTRKGFTLAELLVVVAVMGILGGFAFVEVSNYMRVMKRAEMDNVAREIFVAAQNHLTVSKTTGNWKLGYYDPSALPPVEIQKTEYQDKVTYQFSDADSSKLNSKDHDTSHDFYYVIYNPTTYKDAFSTYTSTLTQMLPTNSIDPEVRERGSYVIEFDAVTATVYGVFYTEDGSFTTQDLATLNDYRSDSKAREQYGTNQVAIGYYGGAIANINFPTEGKSSFIEVFNDGRKVVSADDSENTEIDPANINDKALQVFIADTNSTSTNPTKIEVTLIEVQDSSKTATFTINTKNNTIEKGDGIKGSFNDSKVFKTITTGTQYCITLDDILTGKQFKDLFTDITPGTNIAIEAKVYSETGDLLSTSNSVIFNSLFDDITKVDGNYEPTDSSAVTSYEASIRTGRHLQNLSEDLSEYYSSSRVGNLDLISAVLKDPSGNPVQIKWNNNNSFTDSDKSKFTSIESSTLKNFDGNDSILSDFLLKSNNDYCGLFSQSTDMTIKDLTLIDFDGNSSKGTGSLIGSLKSVKNHSSVITNVHVYNSNSALFTTDMSMTVSKDASCGGLIGTVIGDGNTTIQYSSASIKVGKESSGTSGGLIGLISEASDVTIENCYVGGKINSDKKNDYLISKTNEGNVSAKDVAGGFIGTVYNSKVTIRSSYTTASAVSEDGYAGGFIGKFQESSTLIVKSVYSAGSVATMTKKKEMMGSFIGFADENCKFELEDNGYVAVLDMVSNTNGADIVGEKSIDDQGKVQVLTSIELAKLKDPDIQVTAYPYKSSLGNSYPYPNTVNENGTPVPHRGDWSYISSGSGLFYYEKYDNDAYQIHGFNDEVANVTTNETVNHNYTEFGNSSFPTTSTTVVEEEGYILTIADKNFETDYHKYSDILSPEDAITIMMNRDSFYDDKERTLNKLTSGSNPAMVELGNTEKERLGLTDCHAYRLNLDNSIWSGIWNGDNIKLDVVAPFYSANQTNFVSLGRFFMTPYYADSVTSDKSVVNRIIRTASQLNRISLANGVNSFGSYEKDTVVTQELNIDYSSFESKTDPNKSKTIPELAKITYKGGQLTDTLEQVTLTIDEPFVKKVASGSSIQDLNVELKIDQVNVEDSTNYGFFVGDLQGKISNVTFTGSISNNENPLVIQGQNVGIIAYMNGGASIVQDVRFQNLTLNNLNVSSNYFGFIANSTNNPVSNVMITNSSIQNSTIKATESFGLVGNINNKVSNLTLQRTGDNQNSITFENVNVDAKNVGIIGSATSVSDCIFDGVTWKENSNINMNQNDYNTNVSFIGSTNGSITNITVTNSTFDKVNVKTNVFSILPNVQQPISGIKIDGYHLKEVNVKTSGDGDSYVTLIPASGSGTTISDINVNHVTMDHLTTNASYVGVIGKKESGTLKEITVSNTEIVNSELNSSYVGVIAQLSDNVSTSDITVKASGKEDTNPFGFRITNSKITSPCWGVIASSDSPITNLDIEDVVISGVDSSETATNLAEYNYGLIGKTMGNVNAINVQNVLIEDVLLPKVDAGKVNIGIIGSVQKKDQPATLGNAENDTTHVIDNLEISNIKMNDTEFVDYGFIGKVTESMTVSNLTLTHFVSGGNGFVNNNTGTIQNATITKGAEDTTKRITTIKQSQFVNTNSGKIDSCNVSVDVPEDVTLKFYTTNIDSGTITNCKLNDNDVVVS